MLIKTNDFWPYCPLRVLGPSVAKPVITPAPSPQAALQQARVFCRPLRRQPRQECFPCPALAALRLGRFHLPSRGTTENLLRRDGRPARTGDGRNGTRNNPSRSLPPCKLHRTDTHNKGVGVAILRRRALDTKTSARTLTRGSVGTLPSVAVSYSPPIKELETNHLPRHNNQNLDFSDETPTDILVGMLWW